MDKLYVWCSTHSPTPRKHAQPEPGTDPRVMIVLGHSQDDRIVTARWNSDGTDCCVSLDVRTLRYMLNAAETYKPGATLAHPTPTH